MPNQYGFSKSQRLRNSEFQRVRLEGASLRGSILSLGYLRNAQAISKVRVGFITSKKVGDAVLRNRTRRRLREIFRKYQHELSPGTWVVTIASRRAGTASFRALEDEWLRLVRRASILAP